ncbi:MAG TPA: sigma-70 family RNA polymerase sigma factor, partial [Solirubrobacterales bacterium]|nr:sigma-70 family RNA polymerase sigma factor [Solirubrobacterales bacterium]
MDLPSRKGKLPAGDVEALFAAVLGGERGRRLRAQLAAGNPRRSAEQIEDALQTACRRFLDRAEAISTPAQVFVWLRTTADRLLGKDAPRHVLHELPVDPGEATLQLLPAREAGPEAELIAHEDEAEMANLVREVSSSLPERQRQVLALYGAGFKRPQIAARLGVPERTVKYDLREIMDRARCALAKRAGGGCERGEPLVLRFAYGLATAAEAAQARLHLHRCRRCSLFAEQLDAWREKAAALAPLPAAAEAASPGLLGRLAHRSAEELAAVKRQLLGAVAQARQHASSVYYRALDPTSLAAARPGTVAAVVAGCVTIGGGAATYCAQQGIDPLGAARSLLAGTEEHKLSAPAPPPKSEPAPVAAPPPVSEAPPASEAAPPAEAKKESPPPSPPPEAS